MLKNAQIFCSLHLMLFIPRKKYPTVLFVLASTTQCSVVCVVLCFSKVFGSVLKVFIICVYQCCTRGPPLLRRSLWFLPRATNIPSIFFCHLKHIVRCRMVKHFYSVTYNSVKHFSVRIRYHIFKCCKIKHILVLLTSVSFLSYQIMCKCAFHNTIFYQCSSEKFIQ